MEPDVRKQYQDKILVDHVIQIVVKKATLYLSDSGKPRNFAQGIMVNTTYRVTFLPINVFKRADPIEKKASENCKDLPYRGGHGFQVKVTGKL